MKRSEAIKLLQNSFIEHTNCRSECCNNDDEMYSKILKTAENIIAAQAVPVTVHNSNRPNMIFIAWEAERKQE